MLYFIKKIQYAYIHPQSPRRTSKLQEKQMFEKLGFFWAYTLIFLKILFKKCKIEGGLGLTTRYFKTLYAAQYRQVRRIGSCVPKLI
jgi:hypothetical protein